MIFWWLVKSCVGVHVPRGGDACKAYLKIYLQLQYRYTSITCENQPKLYFSVGLKYRSTADGKYLDGIFPYLITRKYSIVQQRKINPIALTVDLVLPFWLKNQLWLVVESLGCA